MVELHGHGKATMQGFGNVASWAVMAHLTLRLEDVVQVTKEME